MAHQALYRQYRPQKFDDVVEQQHVVTTLKNIVISGNTAHAYLFCGTRGTGKTTMAKIFARAVNCLHPENGNPCNACEVCEGIINGTLLDVTEIDAASNNSVDNVRGIIDEVVYRPTRARKKVYIIDEVHMLSSGAFNALLKTLEEPPEHVLFILATTEPHKLPATVLSRCQRFDFRRISNKGIVERLLIIAGESGVSISSEAVHFIASLSGGALRDGISILDQCIATEKNPLTLEDIHECVGVAPNRLILDTADFLIDHKGKEAIVTIDRLISDGKDPGQFLQGLIQLFRDILVYQASGNNEPLLSMTEEERETIPGLAHKISVTEALAAVRELSDLEATLRWSSSPRILLEMAFLRICSREIGTGSEHLADKIKLLEERIRKLENDLSNNSRYTVSTQPVDVNPAEKSAPIRESLAVKEPPAGMSIIKQKPSEVRMKCGKPFDQWDRVMEELRKSGRMKLFTSLIGSTAVWKDENIIMILLEEDNPYQRQVITKTENIEAITEVLKRCTGKNLQPELLKEDKKEEKQPQEEVPGKILDFARKSGIQLDIIDE